MAEDQDTPAKDFNLYRGRVTNNIDAQKRGHVRVNVPGKFEPDVECEVVMPGSPFNQGLFIVPAVGAEVLVGMLQGEYDSPIVLGGFTPPVLAGGSRALTPAEDLVKMIILENEDFRVILGKEGTTAPFFQVTTRPDAEGATIHLLMALNGFVQIAAPKFKAGLFAAIELVTPFLSLNGRITQIRNRPVGESNDPI